MAATEEAAKGAGDIWAHLINCAEEEKKAKQALDADTAGNEATAMFVGAKGGGKSSVIAKFLDPKSKKEHKPTTALEYMFGRKTSESGYRLVHLWELGGGIHLSDMVKVAMKKETFANTVCLVVVDLSKPDEVVDTARYWLRIIQHRAEAVASELQEDGVDVVKLMAEKNGSPQAKGIPIYIVANKYDTFKDRENEAKKIMSRTLRAMALEAGASLVYMTVQDSADKDLQSCGKVFRNLLNSNVFGTDRLKVFTTAENRALAIRAGDDREDKIGIAPGSDNASSTAWVRNLEAIFPPPNTEAARSNDEKVNAVRKVFSRLSKGEQGVHRRELRDALSEMPCGKLLEFVHSSEVGGTPHVSPDEFESLLLWWRSMLALEGIEGEVGAAFDAEEYKDETVDAMREMRDGELEKYRKACEARVRRELALKGERKQEKGGSKRRGSTSNS